MKTDVKTITENTLIPLSAIALVFGAAMWLTTIFRQGEANANEIKEIKESKSHDLEKIETKIDKINDKVDRLLQERKLQ